MVGTNCYVVYNENTKECFVVDPAAPSAPLVEFIQTEGLQLQGISGSGALSSGIGKCSI